MREMIHKVTEIRTEGRDIEEYYETHILRTNSTLLIIYTVRQPINLALSSLIHN